MKKFIWIIALLFTSCSLQNINHQFSIDPTSNRMFIRSESIHPTLSDHDIFNAAADFCAVNFKNINGPGTYINKETNFLTTRIQSRKQWAGTTVNFNFNIQVYVKDKTLKSRIIFIDINDELPFKGYFSDNYSQVRGMHVSIVKHIENYSHNILKELNNYVRYYDQRTQF